MKKILLGMLCMVLLTGCGKNNPTVDNPEKEKEEGAVTEVVSGSEYAQALDAVYQYATKLYENGDYTRFEKVNDIYYISLEKMKEIYNYDMNMLVDEKGNHCSLDKSGVYFDTENKKGLNMEGFPPIITTLVDCFDK